MKAIIIVSLFYGIIPRVLIAIIYLAMLYLAPNVFDLFDFRWDLLNLFGDCIPSFNIHRLSRVSLIVTDLDRARELYISQARYRSDFWGTSGDQHQSTGGRQNKSCLLADLLLVLKGEAFSYKPE